MKHSPIIFSKPMVQAILEGLKTQTRRLVKHKPSFWNNGLLEANCVHFISPDEIIGWSSDPGEEFTKKAYKKGDGIKCLYGGPGDRLWVRETFAKVCDDPFGMCNGETCPYCKFEYRADTKNKYPGSWPENFMPHEVPCKWKPSIHMPRAASRITLKINELRVERLQDISEEDAIAEGVSKYVPSATMLYRNYAFYQQEKLLMEAPVFYHTARESFKSLWETIHGPESWKENPFVWVIEFEKI